LIESAIPSSSSELTPSSSRTRDVRLLKWVICIGLAAGTVLLYSPVRHHGFVKFDDDDYVLQNPHVLHGLTFSAIKWAFLNFHSSNWHPLTWLSHMLDVRLWGLNAGGHHLTNVLIHATTAVLLFLLLNAVTDATWRSAFVAVVFAWHPLHVESVAWVAERKDVLSGLFWVLTIAAYARYVRNRTAINYFVVGTVFTLGLMCKPMLVTLPIILLILDYWPFRRASLSPGTFLNWLHLLVEKVPLFLLAGICSWFTYVAQHHSGAIKTLSEISWQLRIANAVTAYVVYIGQALWPVRLCVCYPLPSVISPWTAVAATALLVTISVLVIALARRTPAILCGWMWYLISLIPVIGIVQVGFQARADRYTYIPMIGLTIAATWGMSDVLKRYKRGSFVLAVIFICVSAAMLQASARQLTYWQNSFTLFNRALAVTSGNWLIENNLSNALLDQAKETEEAKKHAQTAIEIRADFAPAHVNLGIALLRQRRVAEATAQMKRACELQPNWPDAYFHLGSVLMIEGKTGDAIQQFETTLRLRPDTIHALKALAWIRATDSDPQWRNATDAVNLATRAVRLTNYEEADILDVYAAALAEAKRFSEAIEVEQRAHRMAAANKNNELAEQIRIRLDLYTLELPYRSKPAHLP
jgi:cytochrome c-type biogenesis protein CcmH/NrfG